MKRYWLSLIIEGMYKDKKPWLCAMTNSFASIEDAKKEIDFKRGHHTVLSAWIDTYDDGETTTEYHKCFMTY